MSNDVDVSALPDVFQPYLKQITASIKPCVNITLTAQTTTTRRQSKVGGTPYLPKTTAYPCDAAGKPLLFLAQFNFADVPPLPDFPERGLLQFYIGNDDVYGLNFDDPQCQDTFRVLYFDEVLTDDGELSDEIPPMADEDCTPFSGQYTMAFAAARQAVSSNDFSFGRVLGCGDSVYDLEEQYDGKDFYTDCIDVYDGLFPDIGHRLGGYPFFTQTDPREYHKNLQDYVLLFQLDTDDYDGKDLMWGDCGVGNFFIHPDDLRRRDFSKVVYNWDCC